MISRLQSTPESAGEHFLTAPDDCAAGLGHTLKTMEHVEMVGEETIKNKRTGDMFTCR